MIINEQNTKFFPDLEYVACSGPKRQLNYPRGGDTYHQSVDNEVFLAIYFSALLTERSFFKCGGLYVNSSCFFFFFSR